jgi:EmrB/QacA subfamily drug resistance transporter
MSAARRWATLAVVSTASFAILLATSSINVALPSLVRDLSASTRDLQWIVDGYNLAFASFVLAFGSLSDRYGRKGALLSGLAVFGLAAVAGSRAGSAGQLITAQAVMGLGAAMIFPTTLSIISNTFPERRERARAIGIWGAVTGMGGGIGPVLGGGLLAGFWWGSILLTLGIVAAVIAVAVALTVITSRDPSTPRLDKVGLVLSVLAVGALVYTVIEAPARGWLAPLTIAGFTAAELLLIALVRWELHTPTPMIDVRLFRNRRFSAASGAVAFGYFALFGFIFLGTMYMQFVKGYSPLNLGVRLLPMAGAVAVGSLVGTMLAVRIGNKVVITVGMLMFATVFRWISVDDAATGYPALVGQMVMIGLALGSTSGPATEAIMGAVSTEKAGIGSVMNDATRELGGTLGVAVMGSISVSLYADHMTGSATAALPPSARDAAAESIGAAQLVAARLPDPAAAHALMNSATGAFLDGFAAASLAAAGVTLFAALVTAICLPSRPAMTDAAPAALSLSRTSDESRPIALGSSDVPLPHLGAALPPAASQRPLHLIHERAWVSPQGDVRDTQHHVALKRHRLGLQCVTYPGRDRDVLKAVDLDSHPELLPHDVQTDTAGLIASPYLPRRRWKAPFRTQPSEVQLADGFHASDDLFAQVPK